VTLFHRIFSPTSSLRPALACEVTPDGVLAARQAAGGQVEMSFAPLANPLSEDIVRPGLTAPNFADREAVVAALRQALDDVVAKERALTLEVPDATVRVLILDFDSLPAKPQEALPIVRFRLRKLAPFDVDHAAVSYQVMRQDHGSNEGRRDDQTRALVTVMPAAVRSEYEDAVRAAGYEPGVVLPSMLASLAAARSDEAALVVNRSGLSLTTAIASGEELLLHRTMELPTGNAAQREEMAQAVTVASAYFEDTMNKTPNVLYYNGPGGASEFAAALGPEFRKTLHVRDLAAGISSIPAGLAAGVMGALAT
jgi:type IV pilus assembly protein PilM